MNPFAFPVRRPVATAMFFLALVVLGVIGWQRIPIELLPALEGDRLYVQLYRPGSEPEVIERELLLPLEARVAQMDGVEETRAQIRGSGGQFEVRFGAGTELKMRELELQRVAADLVRGQPRNTIVSVGAQDLSFMSRFVMVVQVTGGADRNSLRDLIDERIEPRIAAVTGVGQVMASGGASRELTVEVDPDRCAALGVRPDEVTAAVARSVQRVRYLGSAEDADSRSAVMLEGRPAGIVSVGEIRIRPTEPVQLRHVADIRLGVGREDTIFRIDGKPAVGLLVFQEEGANLVDLGRRLRSRLLTLEREFAPYGLSFVIGFDAAEEVEKQLRRLGQLALSGFVIALAVLFLFLRQLRAVAVVAVAVPVSLLAAIALLMLGGWTLNLITLFGLAVGIGMLVDNSIVVYEAVQSRLERGVDPDRAAEDGVRRTVRAIFAATVTNAVVFLPVAFATEDAMVRGMLVLVAVAILLPLGASLLVAVGLVPLLARRLAAPAAVARLETLRRRRESLAGLVRPDRGRELFGGVLKVALRRPAGWLAGVVGAVLVTLVVAVPWVAVSTATDAAQDTDEVRMTVEVELGQSLDAATEIFERLESAALNLEGVESVESFFQEGGGTITVRLPEVSTRPPGLTAGRARTVVRDAARGLSGVEIREAEAAGAKGGDDEGGGGMAALLGQGPGEVVISGPDARQMGRLASDLRELLDSIPEVGQAWVRGRAGQDEIRVTPDPVALAGWGLTPDQVLPSLSLLRREGITLRVGWTLPDGREIPLTLRRKEDSSRLAGSGIESMRLATPAGVVPVGALATARVMPPPPTILHHNGRRELSVYYRLADSAPSSGPARRALDERIQAGVRDVHRPTGYTIEALGLDESTSWFKKALVPMLLLLFAVLAITFESLTLPVLVLLAVPLTVLGATWALVFSGMPADVMALVGVVALLGLTVNPAILLVDRMQRRVLTGSWTAGAAALAAVRERTRPVLMTTCTTLAGLWPLALSTGREMEIWPPFATVVMGGLATSTLLTLLVIPVGFVLLARLDRVFGRLGPWVVIAWLGTTSAVMAPLILTEIVSSTIWQVVTAILVGGVLLGVAVILFRRTTPPEPDTTEGPPTVVVRYLSKVYGRPGPIGRALRLGRDFAARVHERGGTPFVPREAWEKVVTLILVLLGSGYLALNLQSVFWRLVFGMVSAAIIASALQEVRRARGRHDVLGRALPGGIEGVLGTIAPWAVLSVLALELTVLPRLAEEPYRLPPVGVIMVAILVAFTQLGRRTAVAVARGRLDERAERGLFQRPRTVWRRLSRRVFGLDLPREEVRALDTVHFRAERGMVGILGPNGAGKTTFLRLLAGILEPTGGAIRLGGVPLATLRRHLARWVGYLPQDFGLPDDLTAREYLDYYALMYRTGTPAERAERINGLLEEVGLGERADDRIGGYSGGMRQRVAVARTLLRLPSVIIVDEPTVGLDPRERIRFRNLLARLARGRVVLFSTHVVEDVAVACERVIVLAHGEVVFDGQPALLAEAAEGRVWEFRLSPGEEEELGPQVTVVDQVPDADGSVRTRVLSAAAPHPEAQPAEPTLEDGYLALVGTRLAGSGAGSDGGQ